MMIHLYRIIGKVMVIIGIPLLVFISFGIFYSASFTGVYAPSRLEVMLLLLFFLVALGLTYFGFHIIITFQEKALFLTRVDEPIHSVEPWKKVPEPGLFLTSCGLIVSTSSESEETAYVGFTMISAEHATCSDCIVRSGKRVLEKSFLRRSY